MAQHTRKGLSQVRERGGERGITLVETLMVLGIATAFIAGSLALYNQATNASRQREAVNAIYGIIGDMRSRFAAADSYGSGPDENLTPASLPAHPWGGTILVRVANNCSGTTCPDFEIVMNEVPQAACDALVRVFTVEGITPMSLPTGPITIDPGNKVDIGSASPEACSVAGDKLLTFTVSG